MTLQEDDTMSRYREVHLRSMLIKTPTTNIAFGNEFDLLLMRRGDEQGCKYEGGLREGGIRRKRHGEVEEVVHWDQQTIGRVERSRSCYVLCGEIDPPWHTQTREAAIGTLSHSSNEVAANKPTLRLTQSTGMFHP